MSTKEEIARFGVELAVIKTKAGRLGLWRTVHAIDEATKAYIEDFVKTGGLGLMPKPKSKKRTR
jgi:hypothetical protein